MLGNADEDCYPQEKIPFNIWGIGIISCFIVFCAVVARSLYFHHKCVKRRETIVRLPTGDDDYALGYIGKDSVFSYFVTDNYFGWMIALATLLVQFIILFVFVLASEANLQKSTIDVHFTWQCPRDTDVCDNESELNYLGWIMFSLVMVGFLAKDLINGSRLIYHSTKLRHNRKSRIRYFVGGTSLCLITVFAIYVRDCKDVCVICVQQLCI